MDDTSTPNRYLKRAKKIVVFVFGVTVVVIGIAMIVLPGPALVFIPLGLVILASEFLWAKWLLGHWKKGAEKVKGHVGKHIKKIRRVKP